MKILCFFGLHFVKLSIGATREAGLTVIRTCKWCGRQWYNCGRSPGWKPMPPHNDADMPLTVRELVDRLNDNVKA